MSRRVAVALTVALALALTLIVVLSRRTTQLTRAYIEARRLSSTLRHGSVVPPFSAVTLGGSPIVVGEGSQQLLFLFTTTCRYCQATLPEWARIADSMAHNAPHIQVLGLSPDSPNALTRYVTVHNIRWPVVPFPNTNFAILYRARTIPQTVLVDSEGHVLYGRTGALSTRAAIDSVYAALARPAPVHDTAASAKP